MVFFPYGNISKFCFVFRAFEFVSSFLHEFGTGDKTLADAVSKAYEQSLRRHHGMLARTVFSVSEIFS
jgi:hypothetical protein